MPDTQKPDLSEHEEEAIPFDDVLKRLLEAKPQKARDQIKKDAPKCTEAAPDERK